MGSLTPPPAARPKRSINVFVIGFGPFGPNTVNPSNLIARALPTTLALAEHPEVEIHLHAHQDPLRVSYTSVLETIPPLLFPQPFSPPNTTSTSTPSSNDASSPPTKPSTTPNFDLVILIGMAGGRSFYTLETLARRDGPWKIPDVDSKLPPPDIPWVKKYGAPQILKPALDVKGILTRWRAEVAPAAEEAEGESIQNGDSAKSKSQAKPKSKPLDVRLSIDAGRYLCEFVLYTALVEYWRQSQDAPVCFLHVPGETDDESIARGKTVVEGLVKGVIAGWV